MEKTHAQGERSPARDAAGRRRFLKLVAGSAAALMVGAMAEPRMAASQSSSGKAKKKAPKRTPKIETELENQRSYVASTLETIRGFELPTGSEVGFVFRPMRKVARSKRRRSR